MVKSPSTTQQLADANIGHAINTAVQHSAIEATKRISRDKQGRLGAKGGLMERWLGGKRQFAKAMAMEGDDSDDDDRGGGGGLDVMEAHMAKLREEEEETKNMKLCQPVAESLRIKR